MKKTALYIAILLMSSMLSVSHGQCDDAIGGIVLSNDTTICDGASTTLELTGSVGSITWLYRDLGSVTWNLLIDETDSVSIVSPNTNRQYIAILTGSCTDSSNIITVRVSDFPEEPNPGFGGSECGLKAYPSAVSSGKPLEFWAMESGPGNAVFYPNIYASVPDSVVVDAFGDYQFAWNISEDYCTKDSKVSFTFNERPKANAGFDTNHCTGVFQMNAIPSIIGSSGEWSRISGGTFNFIPPQAPDVTVNANPGDYLINWRETYNGCWDDDTVRVRVATQPVANAGNGGSECGREIRLNASQSIYFGNWSFLSGPENIEFDNSNNYNALATASDYGESFVLQWKLVNSFCTDSASIEVNFYEQPIADAGFRPDVCGDTAILKANRSIGDGLWFYNSGPGSTSFDNNLNDSTWVFNNSTYGAYSFIWQETNSTCVDSDTVSFSFFEQPISFAGQADSACGQHNVLRPTPSVGLGSWSTIQGPGIVDITITGSATSPISVTNYGVYILQWKEENDFCADSSEVTLSFFQQPIANAGLEGDTCGLGYTLNAIQNIGGSTGEWNQYRGIGSAIFTPEFNDTSTVVVSENGVYEFVWIETNALCVDSDTLRVDFKYQPVSDPGLGGDACGISFPLSAKNNEVPGIWVSSNTSDEFLPSREDPTATVEVGDTGIYSFTWRVDNGVCSSDSSITVHFYEQAIVSILQEDFNICSETAQLRASISVGDGIWTQLSGDGTADFANINSPSTNVSVSQFDDYTFQWLGKNGLCSDSNSISVVFLESPIAEAGSDTLVCGLTYTLDATSSVGEGVWKVLSGPQVLNFSPTINDANAEMQATESGIYTLEWIEENRNCIDSDTLILELLNAPVISAGNDQELYNEFETYLSAELLRSSESGTWSVIEGDGRFSDESFENTEVTNLILGENTYLWAVTNGTCRGTDTVKISVYDVFIPEVITPNGDGENDLFVIYGIEDIENVEFTVFNRWGMEVYYSSDYQSDWDGTNKSGAELSNDTYFYVLKLEESRIVKGFMVIKR